jgi:cardiolipin synthase A/B
MRHRSLGLAGCLLLAGCSLSHPHYIAPDVHVGEPAFARALEAHTLSSPIGGNRAELLLNGDQIFPAMLTAIRRARATVTFANFIFEDGAIAQEMTAALAERCRAGVRVHVLLDAVGSSQMPRRYRTELTEAGCRFAWFHSLNPFALKRINHRNHRRILVVDGRVGFTGGIGVGTDWTGDGREVGHWRQTDVRVEGPVVRLLQAAFAENWRDATGTLLGGDAYFPPSERRGELAIQSVKSSPASGSAEAYLLFLLAIDGARSSIYLTNPYFVPDSAMADALVRAAKRGVQVSVITAGATQGVLDRLVRRASHAHYARATKAGVKMYEYGPALLHAKTLVVDARWVSIGSANLDNRSFALNNELNVVFLDPGIATRLIAVFRQDLQFARPVKEDELQHRLSQFFYLPILPLRDQL